MPTEVAAQAMNLDCRFLAQLCCRDVTDRWRDDAIRRVISDAAIPTRKPVGIDTMAVMASLDPVMGGVDK